jgi:hypothetical protein
MWLCKCDCGNEKKRSAGGLRNGSAKTCGCFLERKRDDISGKRYGKLIVINRSDKKDGQGKAIFWNCICDCGKKITVSGTSLRNGHTKSCGCSRYDNKNSRPIIDITGQRYGRLTVIEKIGRKNKHTYWKCQCDCGKEVIVTSNGLRTGKTKSCGCLKKEISRKAFETHGLSKRHRRLHAIWCKIKIRCFNKNAPCYKNYGGRGITMCLDWADSFQRFFDWAMTNGYTDELTIDRINNNGNYEPSNCRWATPKEQARNRRTSVYLTINGITMTLPEWADRSGINLEIIRTRINRYGWSPEKAVFTPLRGK